MPGVIVTIEEEIQEKPDIDSSPPLRGRRNEYKQPQPEYTYTFDSSYLKVSEIIRDIRTSTF